MSKSSKSILAGLNVASFPDIMPFSYNLEPDLDIEIKKKMRGKHRLKRKEMSLLV